MYAPAASGWRRSPYAWTYSATAYPQVRTRYASSARHSGCSTDIRMAGTGPSPCLPATGQ